MQEHELVRIAYKKFKANLYFDKTQLPLRDRLVLFENEGIEEKLDDLYKALMIGENWEEYEQRILDQIGVLLYPKSLQKISDDTAIFNADSIPIEMKAPQYFIDLPVEGHILGALWILSIGLELDKNSDENNPNGMYEHSYGNRLRKTLINKESNDITYSPSLFEPYFAQYESWRDYGLERAKERLDDKQDAIILTLDFKSFYYSVHMDEGDFQKFLSRVPEVHAWHKRVNDFVFRVISKYSDKLRRAIGCESELKIGDRNVLPIGFLPSNILGNWILTGFDDAIIEKWNPVYYGRYVDDIIIVDKVEKNSPLYKKAREKTPTERLTSDDVIRFELVDKRILAQIPGSEEQSDTSGNETPGTETNQVTYKIDADVLSYNGCEITVQSQKVKLFYFQSGSTQALLNCFKTKIAQNASEFRLLPNMDSVLRHRNYSEIFDLRNEEGINKFRGITGIELDKFALSKFLGKYRKVSGMIQSKEENEFEKDLMLILDERTLISNYGTWERLFEILILNNRYDLYKQLAIRIVDAIERYSVPENMCNASVKTHDSLLRVFLSAMQRTTAIVWNADIDRVLDAVCEKVGKLRGNPKYTQALITMFDKETIYTTRTAYCETRMVNKYLLPLPIDCVINNLGKEEANLSVFADMLRMMDTTWLEEDSKRKRVYYPYMVLPQEISFALTCKDLLANTESIDPESQHKSVNSMFIRLNYPLADTEKRKIFSLKKIETGVMSQIASARNLYFTSVDSAPKSEKDKLTIAVGSVKLSVKDFTNVLDGRPNRGYERYEQFAKVFDEAINQKADMLVLPENFLPFEWIPSVARMCANNQLALITGIEHFVVPQQVCNGQVYNLTVVILPYECDDYRFAYVSYHNKVAYAPIEISEIRGRRYTYKEGNAYQLFGWHNVWFPVYCCFELASIQDRAIFQEYADMVVAVEWNKDVPYYSNIIESLSRDLHCCCVQVNSSDYGDSRIVAPKDSVSKDIIKTKGGQNSCILVDTIDIKSLRDFQMLEYSMQKKDGRFKPSPPGINPDGIIQSKRKNKLKP